MTAGLPAPGADTGGTIERNDAEKAAGSAAAARAGSFPSASGSESGQDGSGDLRAEMAAVAHGAFDSSITNPAVWATSPYDQIELAVDALLAAGYRRVSEDDDTIERVAQAMWDEVQREFADIPGIDRTEMPPVVMPRYRRYARSILRILSGTGHSDVLDRGEGSS